MRINRPPTNPYRGMDNTTNAPTYKPTSAPMKINIPPKINRPPTNPYIGTCQPGSNIFTECLNVNAQNQVANNSQSTAPNPIGKIIDNQTFRLPEGKSTFSWYTPCFPFIDGVSLPASCPVGYSSFGVGCTATYPTLTKQKSCWYGGCVFGGCQCSKYLPNHLKFMANRYTDMGCTCQIKLQDSTKALECPKGKVQGLGSLCYEPRCKDFFGCVDTFRLGFAAQVNYSLGTVSFKDTEIKFINDSINVKVNITYTGGFVKIYLPPGILKFLKCNSEITLDLNSPTISVNIPPFSFNFEFNIPLKLSDNLFNFGNPIGDTQGVANKMNKGINDAISDVLRVVNDAINGFNKVGLGLWKPIPTISIKAFNLTENLLDCLEFINYSMTFISNELGKVFNGLSLRRIIDKVTPPIQNIINQIVEIKDSAEDWINKTKNYADLYCILASRILEASINSGNILENILLSIIGLDVLTGVNLDRDISNLGKQIFGITEKYSESYYNNYRNNYYDNYSNNYYTNNSQIQPYYSQYQQYSYSYPNYNGIEKYQTVTYEDLTQKDKNIINDICNRQRGLNFEGLINTSDVNAKYENCKTVLGPYINTNNDIKDWNFNYSSFSVNFTFSLPFYILAFLGITVNPAIVPVLLFLGKTLSISVSMGYSLDVNDLGKGTGKRQFIYSIGISFILPPEVDPKTLGLNVGMSIGWSPIGSNSNSPTANIFKDSKNQNFSISADFTLPALIIRSGMQSIINGVKMVATRSTLGGVITAAAAGGTIAGVNEIGDQSMVFPSMVLGAASLYNAKDVSISLSWTISDYYDVNNQAIKLNNQHKIFQGFSDIPGQGNLITRQATPLNSIPSVSIGTTFTAYSETAPTSGGASFGITVSYNDACNKTAGPECIR